MVKLIVVCAFYVLIFGGKLGIKIDPLLHNWEYKLTKQNRIHHDNKHLININLFMKEGYPYINFNINFYILNKNIYSTK